MRSAPCSTNSVSKTRGASCSSATAPTTTSTGRSGWACAPCCAPTTWCPATTSSPTPSSPPCPSSWTSSKPGGAERVDGMELKVTTYDVDQGVALVTLNRPERLNAWSVRMENEYRWCLETADAD